MATESLSYINIQHLILIKICLVAFIVSGLIFYYYKVKPWVFLVCTGVFLALAFYFFIDGLELLFWGLTGDEVTISAIYNTFAAGSFFSDFAYAALPPFYPPLFFWFFAFWGKIFNLNGIFLAKLGIFSTYLLLPILVYVSQKLYWQKDVGDKNRPKTIAFLLAPLMLLVLIDQDIFISKPYEVLSAFLSVLWVAFLLQDIVKEKWQYKNVLIYGISGGLLFMAYYLWLVFAAIAIALGGLFVAKSNQLKFYWRLFVVAIIVLIVASPYLAPLMYSYLKFGAENWQAAFFLPSGLQGNFYLFSLLSWKNILMVLGFGGLIYYRKYPYIRTLLLFFVSIYIWWLMGLFTLLLFGVPFQEFKGFMFLERSILALALAYSLEKIWEQSSNKFRSISWQPVVVTLGLFFLGANFFFGTFVDQPEIQQRLVASKKMRPEVAPLVEFLKTEKNSWPKLTLQSGINEIAAFVPINSFIYFNQNNSHPAAGFSQRLGYLRILSSASTPKEFVKLAENSPYGPIQRLILFHQDGKYYVFLNLDEMIKGIKEEVIAIDESLITPDFFNKLYDKNGFAVWERKGI